jgi:hypothetical protein
MTRGSQQTSLEIRGDKPSIASSATAGHNEIIDGFHGLRPRSAGFTRGYPLASLRDEAMGVETSVGQTWSSARGPCPRRGRGFDATGLVGRAGRRMLSHDWMQIEQAPSWGLVHPSDPECHPVDLAKGSKSGVKLGVVPCGARRLSESRTEGLSTVRDAWLAAAA